MFDMDVKPFSFLALALIASLHAEAHVGERGVSLLRPWSFPLGVSTLSF
jgi:hypothetical protein